MPLRRNHSTGPAPSMSLMSILTGRGQDDETLSMRKRSLEFRNESLEEEFRVFLWELTSSSTFMVLGIALLGLLCASPMLFLFVDPNSWLVRALIHFLGRPFVVLHASTFIHFVSCFDFHSPHCTVFTAGPVILPFCVHILVLACSRRVRASHKARAIATFITATVMTSSSASRRRALCALSRCVFCGFCVRVGMFFAFLFL